MTAAAAVIDLGSNAMRLAIAEADGERRLRLLESHREAVRLGTDVFSSGVISEETIRRAAAGLTRFRKIIDRRGIERMCAVGTSALRDAHNRETFVERAAAVSGIRVRIIDGEEEARYVYRAVSKRYDLSRGVSLLVDVGGGSIEITIVEDGAIVFSDSVPSGAVRLMQRFRGGRLSPKVFQRLVREYAAGIRQRVTERASRTIDRCIGTGGGIDSFLVLRHALLQTAEGDTVSASELDALMDRLKALDFDERVSLLGLRPDRADIIIPAGIVLQNILRSARIDRFLVPRVGLKDGVLWQLLQQP